MISRPQTHATTKLALLLTPGEAAEALAISPRKLWSMTASGEIPHVRLGRCVRYPVDDLWQWIGDQTMDAADPGRKPVSGLGHAAFDTSASNLRRAT